jgi:hypothetical protein
MQFRRFDTGDSLWDDLGAIICLAAAIGISRYIGATIWAVGREVVSLAQSL